jgi:patatin-related protein
MTTSSRPEFDYTKEIRFAVVMYGGVSLAIYINGIAQEMLRLVRATALAGKDGKPLSYDELDSSEQVYRKLAYVLAGKSPEEAETNATIQTRFVVDIISGTSAGGINGVFLAKALTNGQNIDQLKQLWVQEGAIEKLINDKWSKDPPLSFTDPPTSLLNSQRMYFQLLKAFDGMSKRVDGHEEDPNPALVDELDLFVTTTDLRGVTLPIRLADGVVYERRHRNVFHFVYSSDDEGRNDFKTANNAFLAFAARCTSSFPFAFEPMTLTDIDEVLERHGPYAGDKDSRSGSERWERFFRSYRQAQGVKPLPFPQRSFADGGDLDNKPFTYAIQTLARRHAAVPVERKLIYIEPSPEHPEDEVDDSNKPDFIENVLDALTTLPRYETIREDLQRVVERNRLVQRVNRIISGVERDELRARQAGSNLGVLDCLQEKPGELWTKKHLNDVEFATLDLADMIRRKGRAYIAYHRLEIATATDGLTDVVARVAGFDEESDYFLVLRALVRAWRDLTYTEYRRGEDQRPTMNAFLHAFDLSYPLRRLNFLLAKIDQMYRLDQEAHELVLLRDLPFWRKGSELSKAEARDFREELIETKKQMKIQYDALRALGRKLSSRHAAAKEEASANSKPAPSPIYQEIQDLVNACREEISNVQTWPPHSDSLIEYFLEKAEPADQTQLPATGQLSQTDDNVDIAAVRRAEYLLKKNDNALLSLFQKMGRRLETELKQMETVDAACLNLLQRTSSSGARSAALECMCHYYRSFDDYDMISFPVLYDLEVGEAAVVEIFRVSPEDATALIDERKTKCRKLAGTALGHFGAFLEKLWRENDILWGRLDGAERLITAVLPPDHPQKAQLIGEAQAAIVHDTVKDMGKPELAELIVESLMRTSSGKAEPALMTQFLKKLKAGATEGQTTDLNRLIHDQDLRQWYLDKFETQSRLNPERALESVARATTVIGKMLDDLSDKYDVGTRYTSWLVKLGQIFWGMVEVSVPRRIPNLIFQHWLKLLYLFEVVLIVGSTLAVNTQVQKYGLLTFAITVAIQFATWVLSSLISFRQGWLKVIKGLAISAILVFLVIGILATTAMLGFERPWRILATIHDWWAHLHSGKLPARIILSLPFILFLGWAIRHDLKRPWRRRKNTVTRVPKKKLKTEAR